MIILLGGEKGGTGKSTITTNLATLHAVNGRSILLVDADKQASSAAWAAMRDENEISPRIPCIQKFGKTLHIELKELEKKFDYVFVDCGGRDSIELRSAMLVADRFFSPLRPSQFDAWTLEVLDGIVAQAQVINPEIKVHIFINLANANPRISETKEAQEFTREFENITLAESVIYDRIIFRKVIRDGQSVIEKRDSKAIQEITILYKEVFPDD